MKPLRLSQLVFGFLSIVSCSLCIALCFSLCAFARTKKPKPPVSSASAFPTKSYSDPTTGISFSYPAAWSLGQQPSFYLQPLVLGQEQNAQAIVSFSPNGTDYAKTNLSGLEFTYLALPMPSQADCLDRVRSNIGDSTPFQPVTIHGARFFHLATGDGGMCHSASRNIYAAYTAGKCLLFEAALYTRCPDPDSGIAQLTPEQNKTLSEQLASIMPTVKTHPPK